MFPFSCYSAPHLACVSWPYAGAVKIGLALTEPVLKSPCGWQCGALLFLQPVLAVCLCLLTPLVGLQGVGSLPASADC